MIGLTANVRATRIVTCAGAVVTTMTGFDNEYEKTKRKRKRKQKNQRRRRKKRMIKMFDSLEERGEGLCAYLEI